MTQTNPSQLCDRCNATKSKKREENCDACLQKQTRSAQTGMSVLHVHPPIVQGAGQKRRTPDASHPPRKKQKASVKARAPKRKSGGLKIVSKKDLRNQKRRTTAMSSRAKETEAEKRQRNAKRHVQETDAERTV